MAGLDQIVRLKPEITELGFWLAYNQKKWGCMLVKAGAAREPNNNENQHR